VAEEPATTDIGALSTELHGTSSRSRIRTCVHPRSRRSNPCPSALAEDTARLTSFFSISPGNVRSESRPTLPGTLRFGATPPSLEHLRLGRVRYPALSLGEVTLLSHHRRNFMRCGHTSAPAADWLSPHRRYSHTARGQQCPRHINFWPGNRRTRKGLRPEASNLTVRSLERAVCQRSIRGQSPLALSS
jgi:hypothetical protein